MKKAPRIDGSREDFHALNRRTIQQFRPNVHPSDDDVCSRTRALDSLAQV